MVPLLVRGKWGIAQDSKAWRHLQEPLSLVSDVLRCDCFHGNYLRVCVSSAGAVTPKCPDVNQVCPLFDLYIAVEICFEMLVLVC